jgi:hypothetical protein
VAEALEHSTTETSHTNTKQMNYTLLTLLQLRWLLSQSTDKLKFNIWSVPKGEDVGKHITGSLQAPSFKTIRGAGASNPLTNVNVQRNISAILKSTIRQVNPHGTGLGRGRHVQHNPANSLQEDRFRQRKICGKTKSKIIGTEIQNNPIIHTQHMYSIFVNDVNASAPANNRIASTSPHSQLERTKTTLIYVCSAQSPQQLPTMCQPK